MQDPRGIGPTKLRVIRPMPLFRPHSAVLLLAGLVGGLVGCEGPDPTPTDTRPTAGAETSPPESEGPEAARGMFAVPLVDLQGRRTTLASEAGRPMLIEVWATWCGPCRKVRAIIEENQTQLEAVATLVGVSVDEGGPGTVRSYLEKSPSPGMLEFMVTPEFRAAIAPYDTRNTIPKLVYVGPDGRIATLSHGVDSVAFMTALLHNLRVRDGGS